MADDWKRESISVVLFPSDSLYEELSPLILEWTTEGLLGSFLAVSPSMVLQKANEPLSISVDKLGLNSNGEYAPYKLDAFEELAQREYGVVRIIGLHLLRAGHKVDVKQGKQYEDAMSYLVKALPMVAAGMVEGQEGTRVLRINLVVAPTELHSDGFDAAFKGAWNMHVIASPEDRRTPWTGDGLVRNDEKFKRFALMHLATTAGIWNGLQVSPFELVDLEEANKGNFWLSRVFVNAILTDGLSRRVAAKVVDGISNSATDIYDSKLGISISGTELIPDDLVEQYVSWMVGQVFSIEGHVLGFAQPMQDSPPPQENWYEWTQFKSFLIFSWDKVKVIPWWIWVFIRRGVGRKMTSTFQGNEGLAQVGISQKDPMDSRDRILANRLVEIIRVQEAARSVLSAPLRRNSAKTSPKLWASIRRLVFGMLDGSDLKEFGIEPKEGRVPVFARTGQIIANPSETLQIPESLQDRLGFAEIKFTEAISSESLNRKLAEGVTLGKSKIEEIENELEAILGEGF
jgi:hypothetical protein